MEIKGEKVVLRPVDPADYPRLRELLARPEVHVWWGDLDDDELAKLLVILYQGEIAGGIQYEEETDPDYPHAGIDVFLDPTIRGQGLGVDAVRTLARWLIDERGHHRLTIDPAVTNTAAIRAYEKVGFKPVGVMRKYERNPVTREWNDNLLMDLLAEELAP
ncbi:GNAT family N-acetyltransferase [Streptomyces sp. A7024]|uniref:GNAT family N-acetyltransferase n=1 Tax=Streptomyces coryli TaxID=1128680 RepID=A0A6G4U3K5_9ACTN|nr:GNAT family protein [Streptomyces coryli]NGN66330.1 GNAT family N-acetyltransferase [Streptomyces coryli]